MFRNFALLILLLAIAFGAGFFSGAGGLSSAQAQTSEKYFIDSSWGPLRGALGNRILMFEDANGTVRFVDITKFDLSTKELRVERTLERR